jgi:CheY-like chemotaxis protein
LSKAQRKRDPSDAAQQRASVKGEPTGIGAVATASVLLVDDNEEIRWAVTEILEDEGYTVATAGNGQEALELLRRIPPPRLILLDLMMPVMDGWQFLAQRRANQALSKIPVVILSAFAHSADRVAGVSAIISKPVDPALLIKIVRVHVDHA